MLKPFPWSVPGGSDGKESACNEGDLGLILGSGRSPGGGNGNSLQYSCLSHRQRSLAAYSPWGHKELDVNLQLNTQVLNNKLNWTFLFLNEVSGFLLKQNHGTFLYLRGARKIMVPTRIFTQWQGQFFLYWINVKGTLGNKIKIAFRLIPRAVLLPKNCYSGIIGISELSYPKTNS